MHDVQQRQSELMHPSFQSSSVPGRQSASFVSADGIRYVSESIHAAPRVVTSLSVPDVIMADNASRNHVIYVEPAPVHAQAQAAAAADLPVIWRSDPRVLTENWPSHYSNSSPTVTVVAPSSLPRDLAVFDSSSRTRRPPAVVYTTHRDDTSGAHDYRPSGRGGVEGVWLESPTAVVASSGHVSREPAVDQSALPLTLYREGRMSGYQRNTPPSFRMPSSRSMAFEGTDMELDPQVYSNSPMPVEYRSRYPEISREIRRRY